MKNIMKKAHEITRKIVKDSDYRATLSLVLKYLYSKSKETFKIVSKYYLNNRLTNISESHKNSEFEKCEDILSVKVKWSNMSDLVKKVYRKFGYLEIHYIDSIIERIYITKEVI